MATPKTEKAPSKTAQIKELKIEVQALQEAKANSKDKQEARQIRRKLRRASAKLNELQGKSSDSE